MTLRFTVEEDPRGKARPRFGGHIYTPAATVKYEKRVKAACQDAMRRSRTACLGVPCVVAIRFRLKPAVSHAKRTRAHMLSGAVGMTGRYDIDNQAKAILDALNKVAFVDDRLIVRLWLSKVAAETPGADVMVRAYEQHDLEEDFHT